MEKEILIDNHVNSDHNNLANHIILLIQKKMANLKKKKNSEVNALECFVFTWMFPHIEAPLIGCVVYVVIYVVMLNWVYSSLSRHKLCIPCCSPQHRQAGTVWHRLTGIILYVGSLSASGTGMCVCACVCKNLWTERNCVCEFSLCVCTSHETVLIKTTKSVISENAPKLHT